MFPHLFATGHPTAIALHPPQRDMEFNMQKAINIGLAAAVVLLGAGLVASVVTRPEPGMSATEVRGLLAGIEAPQPIAETLLEQPALDTAVIGPVIEDYLLANPRL